MQCNQFLLVVTCFFNAFFHCKASSFEKFLFNQISESGSEYEAVSKSPSKNFKSPLSDVTISGYPVVETSGGLVMGQTNAENHAFYSVAYAQAPINDLRYASYSNSQFEIE